MKKSWALIFALLLCTLAGTVIGAPAKPAKPGLGVKPQAQPTMEGVLALADKYIKLCEPKLADKDKQAVADVKKTIADNEFSDLFMKSALDKLINQLTLKLASAKSFDALCVSSACVVQKAPKNKRALNLFGSVLHTYGKYKDAIVVFKYILTLDPENKLIKLNLANTYLDDNQDKAAKTLLDYLEINDRDNKAVYRALATYYYKKKNAALFRQYLFKSASFKGYKRQKTDKQKQAVETNDVKQEETTGAMEAKLEKLQDIVPLTTADVLEEQYPDAARRIRDKYGKLAANEKWILPKLPMANLNGPPDYERNKPIINEWAKVTIERFKVFPIRIATAMGVDPNASDAVKEKQAKAAGKKKMAEAMQQAQQSLEYMENMPGISKAQLAKAKAQIQKVIKDQNLKVEDKPVNMAGPPPGMDSGSLFAQENYRNYVLIYNSYVFYFMKYYKEYNAKCADIYKVYGQKVTEENDRFKPEWEKLQKEHKELDHGETDEPCRKAQINHKKRLNAISDNYYRQWSNLYFPQYAQKMKPNLDAFFNVCMLHIRNMNDPKIMEQEYGKVTITYVIYAPQAIQGIGGGGFNYYPETEEEERALEQDVAKAKEEAEAKREVFKQDFKSPEFSFTDWVDDHFVLEVSGEFLALKVSPKAIEFEAYVPGVGGGVKYDFSEQKFESYTSAGLKLEVGLNICGMGAKVEAGGEAWRRTATWDLANGKYSESDTAKAGAKGSFGPVSAGGELQLDTQLNAKVSGQVSLMGTANIQGETTLN